MSIIMNVSRQMAEVPREKWPFMPAWETEPLKVWLSNEYLAVLYRQRADGSMRLTVNRTRRNGRDWSIASETLRKSAEEHPELYVDFDWLGGSYMVDADMAEHETRGFARQLAMLRGEGEME